jgi:hypothetical protein
MSYFDAAKHNSKNLDDQFLAYRTWYKNHCVDEIITTAIVLNEMINKFVSEVDFLFVHEGGVHYRENNRYITNFFPIFHTNIEDIDRNKFVNRLSNSGQLKNIKMQSGLKFGEETEDFIPFDPITGMFRLSNLNFPSVRISHKYEYSRDELVKELTLFLHAKAEYIFEWKKQRDRLNDSKLQSLPDNSGKKGSIFSRLFR